MKEIPITRDLPYYPTVDDALRTLLDLDAGLDSMRGIRIIVPDYRARISRLHIDGKCIGVEVTPGLYTLNDLVVKMYVRGKNSGLSSENLEILDGMAILECDFEPEYVDAILFSLSDGDVVDRRTFSSFGLFSSKDVAIDDIESRLLQIIEGGEGRTTEFKRILNPSRPGEYLESIVAFANSGGGLLIIGVDDNCSVVGYNEESEDSIRNRVNSMCEPPIEVEIRTNLIVRERPITVIEVKEGKNKPYNLRGSGYYVRRGASDYRVSRSELDEIYKSKGGRGILGIF